MTTATHRVLKFVALTGACLSAAVTGMAQNEIIYNNFSTPLNSTYSSQFEFGDEINFAGQNREISRIQVELLGSLAVGAGKEGVLRLYVNDGPSGAPGSLIYQSAAFALANGGQQVDVDTSSLRFPVPETLTWTLSFSGLANGESAGALLYNPPTVGSSASDFWQKNVSGTWSKTVLSPLPANFGARFTAVPEPGVLQLGALGAMMLGGYAMRRRAAK